MQPQTWSRKPISILVLFLACMIFAIGLFAGSSLVRADNAIVYVNANATSAGDGQTWGTAYKYLQDALDEANAAGQQ